MATASRAPTHRPVKVAPNLTDPAMRNSKGPAELLLKDELGDSVDDDRDHIFNKSSTTKEELETTPEVSQNSTVLIVVFALIVIALVALIVWMIMKQSNDKKDEEELRRVIHPQPHPRNNMPPMRPPNQTSLQDRLAYEEHQRTMQQMQMQQMQMQRNMQQMNNELVHEEPASEEHANEEAEPTKTTISKATKPKTFADVMSELEAKKPQPVKDTNDSKFTKDNPHPDIIRPGVPHSDVDDVLAKTDALLTKKAVTFADGMSDLDKALLDKVTANGNTDDDDDEEEDD